MKPIADVKSPFSALLIDIGGLTSATQLQEENPSEEAKKQLLEDAVRAPILQDYTMARCDAAISAYRDGLAHTIIFNGGPGAVCYYTPSGKLVVPGNIPRDSKVMHPDLMLDYVRNHPDGKDIPFSALAVQPNRSSTDTIGSAVFIKPFLEQEGWINNYFVSNHFHIPRSLRIFNHVLGPRFATSGLPVFTRMDQQQLYANENPAIFHENLGAQPYGDDAAIELWLFTRHGIYSKIGEPELASLLRHNSVDSVLSARQ